MHNIRARSVTFGNVGRVIFQKIKQYKKHIVVDIAFFQITRDQWNFPRRTRGLYRILAVSNHLLPRRSVFSSSLRPKVSIPQPSYNCCLVSPILIMRPNSLALNTAWFQPRHTAQNSNSTFSRYVQSSSNHRLTKPRAICTIYICAQDTRFLGFFCEYLFPRPRHSWCSGKDTPDYLKTRTFFINRPQTK